MAGRHLRIIGTDANDVIEGGDRDETIFGEGGDDTIDGGGGDDVIYPGTGNNILDGGTNSPPIPILQFGTQGRGDWLIYDNTPVGVVASLATGQAFRGDETDTFVDFEYLVGSIFDDVLEGDAEDNPISGRLGSDIIRGLGGDDLLFGDSADVKGTGGSADQLDGGDGNDALIGGLGDDILDGGPGAEDSAFYGDLRLAIFADLAEGSALVGTRGEADTLLNVEIVVGSKKADVILGDDLANRLRGQEGSDRLEGRGGDDYLQGGTQKDTFVFAYSATGQSLGNDIIDDLTALDRLAISLSGDGPALSGKQLFASLDDGNGRLTGTEERVGIVDVTNREGVTKSSLAIEFLPGQSLTLFGVTELTAKAFVDS